ncbi:MAG: hypothetical protein KatS3mg027_0167 [Bacteroidia bacterium]|nr:MAG: hypothetical protein KatS3mg027_0167 [Bacteroidia bacterium]
MYLKPITISELNYSQPLLDNITIFHNKKFLSIYSPYLRIVGIFNNHDDCIGLFYYFKKSKWGFHYIIPPPYQPYNGLCVLSMAQKEESKNTFLKTIQELIIEYFEKNEQTAYMKFVLPPEIQDTQAFQWANWSVKVHYTYQLHLELSETQLFENLSSEKRKSIRKAEKDGIKVRQEKNYTIVKQLILKTFQRQNKKVNEFYLDKLFSDFANDTNSFCFVAYWDEKPIATTFCVYDHKTAYYLLGGYDAENKHHGAGVICMWKSILKSKALGLKTFDFEGSMLPAVERYFREFGGKLVPYYVCEKKIWWIKWWL